MGRRWEDPEEIVSGSLTALKEDVSEDVKESEKNVIGAGGKKRSLFYNSRKFSNIVTYGNVENRKWL